jgi:hypothetical protein
MRGTDDKLDQLAKKDVVWSSVPGKTKLVPQSQNNVFNCEVNESDAHELAWAR